ncbi:MULTISPECIES: beta strand repeat-containing protein [unclassified Bradyrhizobium]|uniref:beta strand repeat-containing protein n=1 Tax=unclassified Bradyrhizobium TaxID=2631580 RepID=UPI0029170F21|nr:MULTISPECIES: GLUG motif-containing protein [unclassified Bradyrhizobium]
MFDQFLTVRIRRTERRRPPVCFATMTAVTALLIGQRAAFAAPLGGTVVEGSAGISQSGSTTNINQSTNKAIINWQGFSIGAGETVNFNQPGSSSVTLNRVIGNETSVISGALNANGQVFIVNSAGVLFGKNAQVNVGGLVASTLDISNANFMAGKYTFSGSSSASVVNQGSIHAHGGGYVALLGNTVSNDGVISARLGTVAMAAGSQITLNFGGNSLLDVTIDRGTLNALVENKRAIIADGGQVIMTAKAADGVLSAQVNNSGIIQARTMAALTGGSGKTRAAKTGSIKLIADGGTTTVSGKLDASAPKGGDGGAIETSGNKVKIADDAVITTLAPSGKSGTWLIDPDGYTIASSGGDTTGAALSALLATNGTVTIASTSGSGTDGNINVNDTISWSTSSNLVLNATNGININSAITAASGGLTLNATGQISAIAAVNVGTFTLASGTWRQVGTALASFSATDFRIAGGTFIRALGGDGSSTNPYQIADIYGLQGLGSTSLLGSSVVLANDVDASGTASWNSGAGFTPIGNSTTAFSGVFDGGKHTIKGLTINAATSNVGLFGVVGLNAVVHDIGITNARIVGSAGIVGGLAGINSGTISNSYIAASNISGSSFLGGLVGWNSSGGVIQSSYADGVTVAGTATTVGGLVGATSAGSTVKDSHATSVAVSGSKQNIGGLAGSNSGTLDNTYATGTVNAVSSTVVAIGGLVGTSGGKISNSHSDVAQITVTGGNGVGGLAGTASAASSISNSYADTAISATNSLNIGGLVGYNSGTITGSHATGDITVVAAVSGGTGIGGLVGTSSASTAISDSYASGNVTVTGAAAGSCPNNRCGIGGLVGVLGGGGTISGSHATGNVTAPDSSSVGGLVGDTGGATIVDSYATGNVIGRSAVGGLVGRSTGVAFPSGKGSTFSGDHASGNVTSNDPNSANTGSLVGMSDNTTVTNSAGSGRVSTVASRAQDAADAAAQAAAEAAARAAAAKEAAAKEAAAKEAAAKEAAAKEAAAKEAAAQTAQAASRSANTVASNAATSAATPPNPASSTAGTQATSSPAGERMDDSLKTIGNRVKADDDRARRRTTAAVAGALAARRGRGNNGNGGSDLGATIRSIEVDGERFDLQGGGKKDAPAEKPQ